MGQNVNQLHLFTMHLQLTHSKGTIKAHKTITSNTWFIKAYYTSPSLYDTRHKTKIEWKYVSWYKVYHYRQVSLCHTTHETGNNLYTFLCRLNYFPLMMVDIHIFTQTQDIKTISIPRNGYGSICTTWKVCCPRHGCLPLNTGTHTVAKTVKK